jgi:two-component system response regulator HydG
VPPLRERKEDIPALVDHFLKKYAAATGKHVLQCSKSAMELFMDHTWDGNVRELENAIERAVVMASGSVVGPGDLPATLQQRETTVVPKGDAPEPQLTLYEHEKRLIIRTLKTVRGNKYQAAKKLGITRSTLYSKIEKYGLDAGKYSK